MAFTQVNKPKTTFKKKEDIQEQKILTYPKSDEVELAVISNLLRHSNNINLAFSYGIDVDFFFDEKCRNIFLSIENLKRRNVFIDANTVTDNMKQVGNEIEFDYVLEISKKSLIHSDELKEYLDLLSDLKEQRKLLSMINKFEEIAMENKNINEKLVSINNEMGKINKKDESKVLTQETAGKSFLKFLKDSIENKGSNTIKTGLDTLDHPDDGLVLGQGLHIIAARPGVGKTSLADQIMAKNSFINNKRCMFFSIEMNTDQLIMRQVQRELGIFTSRMRAGNITDTEYKLIENYIETTKNNVVYSDISSIEISRLKSIAMIENSKNKLDYIVVDYLQLITSMLHRKDTKNNEIAYISNQLVSLSKDLNIPVIALAQLNRSSGNEKPGLENLRDSGQIEQDATSVTFIHRKDMYNANTQNKNEERCELIVAKNRFGKIKTHQILFVRNRTRFDNYIETKEEDEEYLFDAEKIEKEKKLKPRFAFKD